MSCRTHFRSLIILTSCSASPPAPRPPKNWLMCQAKKALRQQGQHRHRRSLTHWLLGWRVGGAELSQRKVFNAQVIFETMLDIKWFQSHMSIMFHYGMVHNTASATQVDISALEFAGSFEGWGAHKRVYEKRVCLKSFKNWCLINVDHHFPHKIAIWIHFRH